MTKPILRFWFEFASTYSYLSAMRIEALARNAGLAIAWRPFLLGPIFAAQGWTTSPFNLYPAKGRYMWRDMEREAGALGLPCRPPEPFPQNSLLPARVAVLGEAESWGPAFAKAVFCAEFQDGRTISDPTLVAGILADLGQDPVAILAQAGGEQNKARLRARSDDARERGIFGAPTFIAPDGELFWGNDRLEKAIAWTAKLRA